MSGSIAKSACKGVPNVLRMVQNSSQGIRLLSDQKKPLPEKPSDSSFKSMYPYIKKLGLGQLPGDIIFKTGNSTFFIPIVTCIIISIVLTVIFNLFK